MRLLIEGLTKPFNTSTLHILIDTRSYDLLEVNKIMG